MSNIQFSTKKYMLISIQNLGDEMLRKQLGFVPHAWKSQRKFLTAFQYPINEM